jgi:hypothetical protein
MQLKIGQKRTRTNEKSLLGFRPAKNAALFFPSVAALPGQLEGAVWFWRDSGWQPGGLPVNLLKMTCEPEMPEQVEKIKSRDLSGESRRHPPPL